ncbi:MAG: FIST C-terminal domain-containing protein [Deltaproteobacteria bacterium]|nr:FIST C-terminal domain-containing protein [Deltaproteobacteria bacterium]
MQTAQFILRAPWAPAALDGAQGFGADLLWVFGAVELLEDTALFRLLDEAFPGVPRVGCSTAGEISNKGIDDRSVVVTAIRVADGGLRVVATAFNGLADSRAAGQRLGHSLASPTLHNVVTFGQGVDINGSAFIDGLTSVTGPNVRISGGLAADGGRFSKTLVVSPAGAFPNQAVAVGISNPRLQVGHGSFGGWTPFGPVRTITRCDENLLYELDGEPALDIYRRYLGEYANGLPASGLLFPFAIVGADRSQQGLVRTILGIEETTGCLKLAGDVCQGGHLQLMHAGADALIDGAEQAAQAAMAMQDHREEGLALLVSCVGRKIMMGDRTEEEIEAVADVLGHKMTLAGFYSNGEISPFPPDQRCRLHNQTMTITCLREVSDP